MSARRANEKSEKETNSFLETQEQRHHRREHQHQQLSPPKNGSEQQRARKDATNNKIFTWTVDRLPRDARQKRDAGVPFGAFVCPFGEMKRRRRRSFLSEGGGGEEEDGKEEKTRRREWAGNIARCDECFGYVNAFCTFDEDGFSCALCGRVTKWKNERERERYKRVCRYIDGRNEEDARAKKYLERLPELREEHNEFLVAAERVKAKTSTSGPTRVILIDATEGGSALEIAKSSAMAALEAVSAENGGETDATFAIMTFDGGLTAYDVVGRQKVRVNDIDELSREEVLLSFEKVMKMRRVFARVDKYKENMLAAIDSIDSTDNGAALNGLGEKLAKLSTNANDEAEDPENGSATKTTTRLGETSTIRERFRKKRAFGPALSLVLDLLGAVEDEITEDTLRMMENEDRNIRNGIDMLNLNNMNDEGDAIEIENADADDDFEENEKRIEEEAFEFDGARVLCFLSGMPNAGIGGIFSDEDEKNALLNDYLSETSADLRANATDALFMKEKIKSASRGRNDDETNAFFFYEHCGRRASVNNVCIDIILCSKPSVFCGLHAISPTSSISGGIILRNDEDNYADDSSGSGILPSEIFKLLQNVDGRTARDCAIRLRTSSDYLVANTYGDSFRDDKKYKGLYHVARMEKADAFAFDFDFSSKIGFGDEDDISVAENSPPILQMAFEYTVTEYDASTSHYWRRRIRRVCTSAKKVARTPREVRDFAKDDAVFALLCRKVFHVMKLDGLFESRLLVIDWLTALISKLAKISGDTYVDAKFEKKHNREVFRRARSDSPPTRLVYALLISKNSPLVLMAYDGMKNENQPDLRSLNLFLCKDRLVGTDLIDFILDGLLHTSATGGGGAGKHASSELRNVEEAMDEKKIYYGYDGFVSFVERISSEEFLSL